MFIAQYSSLASRTVRVMKKHDRNITEVNLQITFLYPDVFQITQNYDMFSKNSDGVYSSVFSTPFADLFTRMIDVNIQHVPDKRKTCIKRDTQSRINEEQTVYCYFHWKYVK